METSAKPAHEEYHQAPVHRTEHHGQDAGVLAAFDANTRSLHDVKRAIELLRRELFPLPFWAIVGASGIGQGQAGVGGIHPGRCMLQTIHNPTAAAVTIALAESGSGDPTPKINVTLAAGATLAMLNMPFDKGITVVASTGTVTLAGTVRY